MKTVLITGINGFLGSHLAKHLSLKYKIIGLANSPENLYRLGDYDFQVVKSTDENITNIFEEHNIFAVLHAATTYKKSGESIQRLLTSNLILPIKLFELANANGVSFFLNTDTFFNFSNSKYNYLSEYTLSKSHVLDWLRTIKGKCTLVNMKLYHMYGPMDAPTKFVNTVISKIKENREYIDLTPGNQKRDFIYIQDVCSAYQVVLKDFEPEEGVDYDFEIGTGKSIPIADFVRKIKSILGSSTDLRFGALTHRDNEIMDAMANNKTLSKLGWKVQFSLEEGLIKTIFNE